jgi:biopolymer transport protein ExbB
MNALLELLGQGGFVMIPIVALSVLLYSRCFRLLLMLRRARREADRAARRVALAPAELRRARADVQEMFGRQRIALGAMIAAAPLLGLLGTVTGMEKTFGSLSAQAGDRSMEGLAQGISEVLVATESGLAVAIPALLLVYLAHREVHRHVQLLSRMERGGAEGGTR